MIGYPDNMFFKVTDLEVVAQFAPSGSTVQDVIEIGPSASAARNAFRLIATFEGKNSLPSWLGGAEAAAAAIPATVEFWAESIGPGRAEVLIGTGSVNLMPGGNPGGHATADYSLYRASLDVPNADTVFVDPLMPGSLQPGVYRIICAVAIDWLVAPGLHWYADTYFDGSLVVRAVHRP